MEIKINKLYENVILPKKAHPEDACFDIYAYIPNKYISIRPGQSALIRTGFKTEIPTGYYAPVYCRSGMGINRHLRLSNSVGIIDSNYRGEWMVSLYNDSDEEQIIYNGDRIAQFTLLPVLEINLVEDDLTETDRGNGGFGSTGS